MFDLNFSLSLFLHLLSFNSFSLFYQPIRSGFPNLPIPIPQPIHEFLPVHFLKTGNDQMRLPHPFHRPHPHCPEFSIQCGLNPRFGIFKHSTGLGGQVQLAGRMQEQIRSWFHTNDAEAICYRIEQLPDPQFFQHRTVFLLADPRPVLPLAVLHPV